MPIDGFDLAGDRLEKQIARRKHGRYEPCPWHPEEKEHCISCGLPPHGGEMDFDEYHRKAAETAMYPNKGSNLNYAVLGLNGEAGEVAEHAKKLMRDDGGVITTDRQTKLISELGDVLWYVAACCSEIGVGMNLVAERNVEKLRSRKERGVITGQGSDR